MSLVTDHECSLTICIASILLLSMVSPAAMGADLIIDADTVLGPGLTLEFDNVRVDNGATLTLLGSMTITVNSELEVGEGATISANGTGYGATTGPGASSEWWRGGSHGGVGGGGPAIYGSAAQPVTQGSGGAESAGGGAIRLEVLDTAVVDGTISANGVDACNGAGSGGSVYFSTLDLEGIGVFAANGGNSTCGQGGGGGGRVAVYYETSSFSGTIEAYGGGGFYPGQPGTAAFFDVSSPDNVNLYTGHAWRFEAGDPLNYGTITMDGTTGEYVDAASPLTTAMFVLRNGSSFGPHARTLPLPVLTLNVGTLQIDGTSQASGNLTVNSTGDVVLASGSILDASSLGYAFGTGPGASTEWWRGGSHGGVGGGGPATYGSAAHPVDYGSGGGDTPGHGGGMIRLNVGGQLTADGEILANGAEACDGAGAGGSIYVTATTLTGNGTLSANGGYSSCGQGGGGGGRIAIYSNGSGANFLGAAEVYGGGGGANGQSGTVAFFDKTNPDLHNLYSTGSWRFETADPVVYGAILLNECAATYAPNLVIVADSFTMSGNSSLSAYDGTLPIAPITLNLGSMSLEDNSRISGNVSVDASGDITIAAAAAISADGAGYPVGTGMGAGTEWYRGGSHGGRGGNGAATYGSAVQPDTLGSGGGGGSGTGGGALILSAAGLVQLDGTLSANGSDSCEGAGSGGTVSLSCGTIAGSGSLWALGGSSTCGNGGGGGGRIAARYGEGTLQLTAGAAGGGGGPGGAPGTVGFFDTSDPAGLNLLAGHSWRFENADSGTVVYHDVTLDGTTGTFEDGYPLDAAGSVTITGGSSLTPYEGRTFSLSIACDRMGLAGDYSEVRGNISVEAVDLAIGATCMLTADGCGHASAEGPGGTSVWYAGGSHGGLGQNGPSINDSAVLPVLWGSGGGDGSGFGGGAIVLTIGETLDLEGSITANAPDPCDGAGAGGSVYITCDEFLGAGTITANGGTSTCGQGGGGGGRIALFYALSDLLLTAYANGGDNGGGAGTVGYFQTLGRAAAVNFTSGPTWRFQRDDEGLFDYGNVRIQDLCTATYENGSELVATGDFVLAGASTLGVYGSPALPYEQVSLSCANLTVGENCTLGGNLLIDTGNLTIAPNGAIRADGCGYPSGTGPGAATNWDSGGGYGGVGGGPGGGPVYGSAEEPLDPGSGGGSDSGGAGGGALRVNASGTVTIHGFLTADGVDRGLCEGGGSGGGIYMICNLLAGTGGITANGGGAGCGSYGGGGGRINVRHLETLYSGTLLALGQAGGADGTVMEMSLPLADFTADVVEGATPLQVQFTDVSDPGDGQTISAWAWDFGDSGTSTDPNPQYTYLAPGLYSVALTITTAAGSDTETKASYILVNPTVSGYVKANDVGLEGVTLAGLPGNPVTDADGWYSAVVPLNWSGTVTPTLAGSTFDPTSRSYENVDDNTPGQDYVAVNPVVSGTVKANGIGLEGVVLAGLPGDPVTGADGTYSVEVPYAWSGTVTPTLGESKFAPPTREYANLTASVENEDYIAVNPLISGTVTENGLPLAGVTMSGLPGEPVTDGDGTYGAEVPYGWSGTVVPLLEEYAFEPESREYANLVEDQPDQDYAGTIVAHSADQNGNNLIELIELLRVIQFYNSSGFHCDASTEDGYAPGPGDQTCTSHASDFAGGGPNWSINLIELLRLIQFYNSGGYHACPDDGTDDGFCPSAPPF